MKQMRISLFGNLVVQCGERPPSRLTSQKAQELLCYLLVFRKRPHTREALASLLWDRCTTAQSKAYLRKTLWELQKFIHEQTGSGIEMLLCIEAGWVEILEGDHLWLDIAAFEHAFAQVRDIPGRQLDQDQRSVLDNAVKIYRSHLLENCCRAWCFRLRVKYQQMLLNMLDKLLDYSEAHHQFDLGKEYGERILRMDPAREQTHRQLMRMRFQEGDPTGAYRQYELCVSALKKELGVLPSEPTTGLLEKVLPGEADRGRVNTLHRHLDRINNLQEEIGSIQRALQMEIVAAQRSLYQGREMP